jgi:hypothetical protein
MCCIIPDKIEIVEVPGISPPFVLGVTEGLLLVSQQGEIRWYFLVSNDTATCLKRPVSSKAVI